MRGRWFPSSGRNSPQGMNVEQAITFTRTAKATGQLVYYKKDNSVVGYRNVGSNVIYANRKFHDGYSVCSVVSSVGHEFMHLIGFDHDFLKTPQRGSSWPYQFNRMSDVCCPKLFKEYE